MTLKTLILFIGLNIILTTIFVLIKEQIQENFQKEKVIHTLKIEDKI